MSRRSPLALCALLALLALLACGPADPGGASSAGESPGFVVENPSGPRPFHHDLGVLLEGELGHHVFELRNRSGVPATILRLQSDCGCTVPRLLVRLPEGGVREGTLYGDGPVIVVPPDGVLEVAVQLDTASAQSPNAHRLYRVTALTDLPQDAYLQFELTAFVDSPLQITPKAIDLGDVPVTNGGWGSATAISAVAGAPVRIEGVASEDPNLEATLEGRRGGGGDVWEIRVELAPGLPFGPYRGEVLLDVVSGAHTEGALHRRQVSLPVRAQVVEDVVARPELVTLRPVAGQPGVIGDARIISLIPGHRMRLGEPRLEGSGAGSIEVELEPLQKDSLGRAQEWRLRLRAPGELEAPGLSGMVRIQLEEPEGHPGLVVRYLARPR